MDRAKHMDENVAALNFEATSNHVEEEVSSRRTNLKFGKKKLKSVEPPSFFKGLRCLVEMSLLFLAFSFLFQEATKLLNKSSF
uniref:Uncharacterized protein n=1 Tax=Populus trichocarpa TaxID=3694 RepID=A0A2K2BBB1_POPTR